MQDYQIFISYKRDPDAPAAEQIFQGLHSRGYDIFLDRIGLEGGSRFPERINSAICSSKLFVLLLSSTTRESIWVKKEINIAIRRAKENKIIIVPIILDGTPQSDFYSFLTKFVFNTFTIIESGGDINNLCQRIYNILEVNSIYPPKDVADYRTHYNGLADAVKSIPADVRTLISECKNCPRRLSEDTFIQCPLFYPLKKYSDEDFFILSCKRLKDEKVKNYAVPKPERKDYSSDMQYQDAVTEWVHERDYYCEVGLDTMQKQFEEEVGFGHTTFGRGKRCHRQEELYDKLTSKIHFLSHPLFQRDLESFDVALQELSAGLDDNDTLILEKIGLEGFLSFLNEQLSCTWSVKNDVINCLIKKEGFASMEGLLSHHMRLATMSINNALRTKQQVPVSDFYSFYILWWLLRDNSNTLTYSLLILKDKKVNHSILSNVLDEFLNAYTKLSLSKTAITFEKVLDVQQLDLPEEIPSIGTDYLGCHLSDFKWLCSETMDYDKSQWSGKANDIITYTYILEAHKNEYNNPSLVDNRFFEGKSNPHSCRFMADGYFYGLSRGSYFAGEGVFDEWHPRHDTKAIKHDIYAVDYLYPLFSYCTNLKKSLNRDAERTLRLSNESYLDYTGLFMEPYNFVDPGVSPDGILCDIEGITCYNAVAYVEMSDDFREAVSAVENGYAKKGRALLELAAGNNDISAILYLANINAYGEKPNYSKALSLFKAAVVRGVRSCFFCIAQCHELLHDYHQANWWYLLLLDDDNIAREELNMRLGNCHYKLSDSCLRYFNDAGEKGQAAKYILGLYSDDEYDFEDNKDGQFMKAMKSVIDKVQPRLGYFQDLHCFRRLLDGELFDEKQSDRDAFEEKAIEGDAMAQYQVGLYELEAFIASEAFIENALNRIKNAAINNSPYALCFMGLFMQQYKHDSQAARIYYEKALRALYPAPFPNLSKME